MTTYGGGIWKYSNNELTNIPIMYGEEEALLVSIYQDKNGLFWLGTDHVGVLTFDGENYERFDPFIIKK